MQMNTMIIFETQQAVLAIKESIKKKEDALPLQNLFKYFNQPFKDISWPYTPQKK